MKVSDRSKLLLLDIVKNDSVTLDELKMSHNLSTRQIDYSIQKMNEVLLEKGIPIITRTAHGVFKTDKKILKLLKSNDFKDASDLFVSDSGDRANLMILIMLVRAEDFSINFFIDEFKISKNTVLRDLKHARKIIVDFNLKITYSRMVGYQVEGQEWDIRNAMIQIIAGVMNQFDGERYLKYYMGISDEAYKTIFNNLVAVEKELDLSFVDTKTVLLPFIFLGVLSRIKLGHHISGIFFIDYHELADAREYDAVKILIQDKQIPEEEKLYFALHLLSSNVYQTEQSLEDTLPQLREAIQKFVNEFERIAFTSLSKKESLVNKIFIHFKPAYYRIKYQLTTDYKLLPTLDKEYEQILNLIEESKEPLVAFLGVELPEVEKLFLSILIGGHLIEHAAQLDAKYRGVIVCQNGLSFSNLLADSLKRILPELYFYPPMSLKELKKMGQPYDFIFTSIPLESEKPVFFVTDLSQQSDRKILRSKVMAMMHKFSGIDLTIEDVVSTAGEYAEDLDREKLRQALLEFFVPVVKRDHAPDTLERGASLGSLITPEMIVKTNQKLDWYQALDLVSQPLLKQGIISHNYLTTIKQEQPSLTSGIVLRERIAIPHTSPEAETKLGMSLLVLAEPLIYERNKQINFIVMIASPNKKAHFKALIELLELAGDKQFLQSIKEGSINQIATAILNYKDGQTAGGIN